MSKTTQRKLHEEYSLPLNMGSYFKNRSGWILCAPVLLTCTCFQVSGLFSSSAGLFWRGLNGDQQCVIVVHGSIKRLCMSFSAGRFITQFFILLIQPTLKKLTPPQLLLKCKVKIANYFDGNAN